MARQILAEGADSFYRVLIDPRDGAPLEIGRTSYRIPQAMRNWLRLRDTKCPFPGCTNHSLDNDADHLTAWRHGGTTGISNLAQPCRKHHRLKHATTWTPTPATTTTPPGWTSPAGRHYPSEPHPWHPPTIPSIKTNTPKTNAPGRMPKDSDHVPPGYPPAEPLHDPPALHLMGTGFDTGFPETRDLHPAHPAWDTYPCPDALPPDPMAEDWEAFLAEVHHNALVAT